MGEFGVSSQENYNPFDDQQVNNILNDPDKAGSDRAPGAARRPRTAFTVVATLRAPDFQGSEVTVGRFTCPESAPSPDLGLENPAGELPDVRATTPVDSGSVKCLATVDKPLHGLSLVRGAAQLSINRFGRILGCLGVSAKAALEGTSVSFKGIGGNPDRGV